MQARTGPLFRSGICVAIIFVMSLSPVFEPQNDSPEELYEPIVAAPASSPGHTVFGEYVGAHWCGPCMNSASPSLDNLKTSNPEDFTYVSFYESSSGGWPNDSPINRRNHVMDASSGYPTFSFADRQSSPCYKVGAGGSNFYDPEYSSGGCMDPASNDFQLSLSMSLDPSTDTVTIDFEVEYTGQQASIVVHAYGAVTEKIGADSYDNGVRPHHNWRGWLLNNAGTGFHEMTLDRNVPAQHTWTKPLNIVRASSGYSQWENYWPVIALMDGPHSTYNQVYAAIDLDMGPLVDLGVDDFDSVVNGGHEGIIPGDTVLLSASVTNNGAEQHPAEAEVVFSYMDGLDHVEIDRYDVPALSPGQSVDFSATFDSSVLTSVSSGAVSLRAALFGVDSDRVDNNDRSDIFIPFDMTPIPTRPTTSEGSDIYRGGTLDFQLSAIPDDTVDDITSMSAIFEYAPSGTEEWSDEWTTNVNLAGAGGNMRLIHQISTPLDAQTGSYDTRVMWIDSRSQASDWLVTQDAFTLRNAIPRVISPTDPDHAGIPTVKVETEEYISLEGLVTDAETPIENLMITSDAHQFKQWIPEDGTILVEFDRIVYDSSGSQIPQGVFITIGDGEDTNTGTLVFNVVENGAPRWSSIPPQSFDEGESSSLILTTFLTDTNDQGVSVNPSSLDLNIVDVQPPALFETILVGHTLSVSAVDEDYVGTAVITVGASDDQQTTETEVTFYINDVNDAPRVSTEGIERLISKVGSISTIDLSEYIYDVDHEFKDLWVEVESYESGSLSYDFSSGVLSMTWNEAGTELIRITAIDPVGDSVEHVIEVDVVDNLPLTWQYSEIGGDLSATFDTLEYSTNPVVKVTHLSQLELVDIKVRWQVCNSLTGVCTDAGSAFGFNPFSIQANEGVGLRVGDYVGLTVTAVDSNGFDRKSEMLKTYAVEPVENQQELSEERVKSGKTGTPTQYFLALSLVVLVLFCTTGMVVIRRRRALLVQPTEKAVYRNSDLPLPAGGLPDGWTMEQWYYYGEEYLRGER